VLNQFVLFKIHGRRFLGSGAALLAIVVVAGWFWPPALWSLVVLGPVLIVGLVDLTRSDNTIIRNFPVLGHFRYLFSSIAPELHQYFVEGNTDGRPFNRNQRNYVEKLSLSPGETHPFGTELDVDAELYEWAPHSIYPVDVMESAPRVSIGGEQCSQPYEASLLNVSAMSFGSLSAAAIRALNAGAKLGGFFHDTGEGGISPYHLEFGADLVWEIGSGYFGCRTEDGRFDGDRFREQAAIDAVKMIEIKLSQGAKPGHGGVLPAAKNSPEIARIRGVKPGTKVVSPAYHREFDDAHGLLRFVQRLRRLSGGKPTGFKLCVGDEREFTAVCRAMLDTGIRPDFITVDGSEGGTGAAPIEFSDSIGMPLEPALAFVVDTLRGHGLRSEVRVLASGKVITGFDLIRNLALGADACNSARGMMFALGCIQALKCDTNECPTGVTTHDPALTRGLVVTAKARRVAAYQRGVLSAMLELIAAMGLEDVRDIRRHHIRKRTTPERTQSLEELYPPVAVGSAL
jgi:glutamate synthase domain-containing protein 2